ncbi:FecCD family ABC transporter permease [Paenibacillus sp. NPDC057967]|uniref:FecCD family ABC transporter permease n=1 Tax=Paenibacillus sp. NPDC057967 TaxID=3346293 RepID=UPI0036D980DE
MMKNQSASVNRGRFIYMLFLVLGFVLLLLCAAASISFGAARINIVTAWEAVFVFDPAITEHQIIQSARIPRTIADIMVGVSLAIAGAIMQGTTRNALADSGLMGVNSGAAFAVALAFAFLPGSSHMQLLLIGFAGAGLGAGTTYLAAALNRRGMTPERLVLAGISITMLFSALGTFVSMKFNIGKALVYWTSGSVAGASWEELLFVLPWFVAGVVLALCLSPSIAVLSLGDDIAVSVGQRTRLVKLLSLLAVLILAGLSTSLVGPVSFVGLIVPHMMRFIVGIDYRRIVPASAIYGGVFMLLADVAGRILARPNELALGIIFAIIGVPFFLFIFRREKRAF